MEGSFQVQLWQLVPTLLISWLVWRFYKGSTSPAAARYATFWPRFWTGHIDSLILWPLGFLTAVLGHVIGSGTVAALLLFIQCLISLLYTVIMHARYGQTIGKMVTQVQVIDFRTEEKISFQQALIREGVPLVLDFAVLGYVMYALLKGTISPADASEGEALATATPFWILASLPALWFLAEVLTMLTNTKRRALHDFMAGTVVVRTNGIAEGAVSPENYPEDYLIKCICCGAAIPALKTVCSKCGWSYKDDALPSQ